MNVKIISDNENKLFARRDIEFEIITEGATISKADAKREVSKKLSLDPDATVIVKIDQSFGYKRCTGLAHSYKEPGLVKRYEPEFRMKRASKGAKEEQPAAEEKKEKESPKEEAKE